MVRRFGAERGWYLRRRVRALPVAALALLVATRALAQGAPGAAPAPPAAPTPDATTPPAPKTLPAAATPPDQAAPPEPKAPPADGPPPDANRPPGDEPAPGAPTPDATSAPDPPSSPGAPAEQTSPDAPAAVDAGLSPDEGTLKYALDDIEVRGNTKTRSRVVLRHVPFRAGDVIDVDDPKVELTRYRLLGTGFFRDVQLALRKGKRRGHVVLIIEVVERNTLIVNDLWMGLGADADAGGKTRPLTAYAGIDAAETNLAGTGITLGAAAGLVGNDQYALRVRFFDPGFLGTTWMTSGTLLYNRANDFFGNRDVFFDDPNATRNAPFAVVRYERFGGNLGVGRDLSISTQLWASYRLERLDANMPLAASHVRGTRDALDREPIDFDIVRGESVLSTLSATLQHDTRDKPFLPTRGWFTSVTTEVSLAPFGSDYPYARVDALASHWWQLPWDHVLRLRLFGGAISGRAPFFERYYAGDLSDFRAARVLGLNAERRPSPNFFGTDVVEVRYGDYAAKLDAEYRVPLYRGTRSVYGIDLFARAGVYVIAGQEDILRPPGGYSGAQLVPIDFTANLGVQIDTSAGGFTLALANVLGFLPALEGR